MSPGFWNDSGEPLQRPQTAGADDSATDTAPASASRPGQPSPGQRGESDLVGLTTMPGLRADGRYLSLQERYQEWRATPDGRFVYVHIRELAKRLRDTGWKHYGIATLWEQARYDRDLKVGPNAGFKLNNDFRSRMARELMTRCPELDGFFETRRLKA